MKWSMTTLDAVAAPIPNAIVDGPFGSSLKVSDYVRDGVPVLQGKNITGDTYRYFDARFITERKAHELRRSSVRLGDILIVKIGSIGYAAEITDLDGHDIAIIPANLAKVTVDCSKVDKRFLLHWFKTRTAKRYLIGAASKTAQPALSLSKIKAFPLPLPPLEEQRRIAAILDQAEELRAQRRAAIALLDQLPQAIFLEMFGDTGALWRSRTVSLAEAYWFQEGPGVRKWQFTTEGVKLLNVSNIEKSGILNLAKTDRCISNTEAYGKYSHFLLDDGDLVIASSGISFDDDGYLRTRGAFVRSQDLPLCLNTSTIRFKEVDGRSDLHFLQTWLQGIEFRSQITRLVTGSAQQNFGPSHLKSTSISLPPVVLQRQFAARVNAVNLVKAAHQATLCEINSLFESLQHSLLGSDHGRR